ncbi:hypothetical protein SAY86_029827 [Trapa natans]|uniref:MATH domain-containing protein n=1 Tax=Trapa natans TaxID=22666 RepID=A0AAN7M1U9_TRANT|nr:hypothetical protein SAY86_029827 [Trapa natans]
MEEGILSGKYAWRINNLSNTRASGLYSQVFTVGGCNWKILLKRKCNDDYIYMPIFLEVGDAASLPDEWCRDTLFTFTLLHPCNGLCSSKKLSTRRTFRAGEISWGFGDLVPLIELSSAISILSRAPAGLSPGQQTAIEASDANFEDFFCDFLTFEKYKSDLKFQTLIKDQMYCSRKRNHETHLSYKQWLHDIAKEKEDLTRKLKELKSREAQLISNWESLMNRSKDMKLRCMAQEKKLAEAQKKKKIAKERMSRGTSAWSNLKEEFL